MALTELQLPSKIEFYGNLQKAAIDMKTLLSQWQGISDFIGTMDTDDMDDMGVAVGQVRTDLLQFRTVLGETIIFLTGGDITRTYIPEDVIDRIRKMVR